MNSAYGGATISKGTLESGPPGIDVQDLPRRGPSIILRSPGSDGVRTRIIFRACSSGPFSAAFDGVSLNDPYHGGVTDSACARNTMPLRRSQGERAQVFLCRRG